MEFAEDKVREILIKLPSECSYLDYKAIPYKKSQYHNFIKDVIAMLNSVECIGKDKFIIFGITDKKELKGLDDVNSLWPDDNEWQNLADKIQPRPILQTGTLTYAENTFAYIYLPKENSEWVYEVKETVIASESKLAEKNAVFKGQAFTRRGSKNDILTGLGREKILDIKKNYAVITKRTALANYDIHLKHSFVAAIMGAWDGNYKGDIEIAEKLSGKNYSEFIIEIKQINNEIADIFSYEDKSWKCKEHKEALLSVADYIYEDDFELFFKKAIKIFKEIDPKYYLECTERTCYNLLLDNEKKIYSDKIIIGFFETIAIMGNHLDAFKNCPRSKISRYIYDLEKEIFNSNDWRIYATISKGFEYLGEACPDIFLSELERILVERNQSFIAFLKEKEEFITTIYYGYELKSALINIAKIDKYFSRAMNILMLLANEREDFLDIFVGIILPWYPQTHANPEARIGILKGLLEENEDLIWKALMKILSKDTVIGNQIIEPKYLDIKDLPTPASMKEYYDVTIAYVTLACSIINKDFNRMINLFNLIENVPYEGQKKIVESIKNNLQYLEINGKQLLWSKAKDLIFTHRKFKDSDWALSEKSLRLIEDFSYDLLVDKGYFEEIRFFRKNQYKFYSIENYTEEKLELKQTEILKKLYINEGLKSLVKFVDKIYNKFLAGTITSSFLKNEDIAEIFELRKCIVKDDFVIGLINSISFDKLMNIISNYDDEFKVGILSKLNLIDECVEQVKSLRDDLQKKYWIEVSIFKPSLKKYLNIDFSIRSFNLYGKSEKSLDVLFKIIYYSKKPLENLTQLVIDTLLILNNKYISDSNYTYQIQELLSWLQKKDIPNNEILILECKFEKILNQAYGYNPEYTWKELSKNPSFYIFLLNNIFENNIKTNNHKDINNILAFYSLNILEKWRRIPGTLDSGEIDYKKLEGWYLEVVKETKGTNIEKPALNYFGKILFYAPKDKNGFFIDENIVSYLQNDVRGIIRSGYSKEAFNSRGIHYIDPTGKVEFEIENSYLEKARLADERGYFRFAQTLREIAGSFHEVGLNYSKQSTKNNKRINNK